MWVLQLDSLGDIQWQKAYGSPLAGTALAVVPATDGGFVAGGNVSTGGSGDIGLLKLDATGNIQWQKAYGTSDSELLSGIQLTPDGGDVVAGAVVLSYDVQGWVMKLDNFGNLQWQKTYGGDRLDWINSIVLTSDGGYALVGRTSSFGTFSDDAWVLKLDALAGLYPVSPVRASNTRLKAADFASGPKV